MEGESSVERTPRERKIRRGIVLLSSFQVALGAIIIGMSFTAFASTSSGKIRSASPYWAGFMVLFTGSVGFLTWKQLSIVSIGIYTFLSTASVVVSLVATVLTGDSAGFLKTLNFCTEVKFEHACECCITNATCVPPYKFPSVRDCSIVSGFLKDIMYGLCVTNIVCCVVCLAVTIVGCTLGFQYSRYSQRCAFRWTQPPAQPDYDHRYNWSPYATDPVRNLPPWAPPIYYPVPNTPRGLDYQYRRPPTLFDPVDFPPPYTSREPSIAGRHGSQGSLEYTLGHNGVSWDRLRPSVFRFFGQGTAGTVSEDSFDYIDRTNVRELGSSSGTSEGVGVSDGTSPRSEHFGTTLAENDVEESLTRQLQGVISHVTEMLPSSSTESDSETQLDDVFTSRERCTIPLAQLRPEYSNCPALISPSTEHAGRQRHSWVEQMRATHSNNIHSAQEEIHHGHIAPNVNPWARSMSEIEGRVNAGNISLPITKQRANSTPCYMADHIRKHKDSQTSRAEGCGRVTSVIVLSEACQIDNPVSTSTNTADNHSLFRHFAESKPARRKRRKKGRRPRNNPGHILEQDRCGDKESNAQEIAGIETDSCQPEYRETTL